MSDDKAGMLLVGFLGLIFAGAIFHCQVITARVTSDCMKSGRPVHECKELKP